MPTLRKFSTEYSVHQGLIHQFARKGFGRLTSANVSVSYDDVFQGMSVTYVKALNKYDPEKGIGFTAYLGRAIWNEFNKYAEKVIGEQVELRLCSVDSFSTNSDDFDLYEKVASESLTPDEIFERKREMVRSLRGLSKASRLVVGQLISPSPSLASALQNAEENKVRAIKNTTIGFIAKHFDLGNETLVEVKHELLEVYGVRV